MSCSVCIEPLKNPVQCPGCEYKVCIKCTKRYILSLEVPVKCMNCKVPWSRKTIVDMCGEYFVNNAYKKRKQELLFELETALMPETNDEAVMYKKHRDMTLEVTRLTNRMKVIKRTVDNLRHSNTLFDNGNETAIERFKDTIKMMEEHDKCNHDIQLLEFKLSILGYRQNRTFQKVRTNNISIRCPMEECRGFVDVSIGKCEMCDTVVCTKCHEKKNDNHTCNPATLETIEMIRKDTRNCPKCKVLIHKIIGCNQMFCVQCKTPFSWTTGEIILGVVHNPHYFEYLQQNPNANTQRREIGDIPCGGLPDPRMFLNSIKSVGICTTLFMNALRICHHIEGYELPRYQNNGLENNRFLRIQYLANEITLKEFKQKIQVRDKAHEKTIEIATVLNTCIVIASDMFRRFSETKDIKVWDEMENIRMFTNSALNQVSKVYNCVVPQIRDKWTRIETDKWQNAQPVQEHTE